AWNSITATGCEGLHDVVLSVPSTGAMARISGASQARRQIIIAPFDIPVAKIRLGSILACRSIRAITARMKPTSSTLFFSAAPQQEPAFQVARTPLGRRL